MGKKIDILDAAIKNDVNPTALIDFMDYDDEIQLQPRTYYDQFSNVVQRDNKNAPTSKQLDTWYNQAVKVKQLVDEGYYRPKYVNPTSAPYASMYGDEYIRPFIKRPTTNPLPIMRDEFSPSGVNYIMSRKQDAYNSSTYAVPDNTVPGGYRNVEKEYGWEKQKGKFIYERDPSTAGMTDMLVLVPDEYDTAGKEQLSLFGPPEIFARNYFGSVAANMLSAIPRLGENVAQIGKSVNNFFSTLRDDEKDIFKTPQSVVAYANELSSMVDAKSQGILVDALNSQDEDKILDAFNFAEAQLPVDKKNQMYMKRMPDNFNKANGAFNAIMDNFERMQYATPEEFKNGAFDSWGSFFYQGAGVLADLAPQMGSAIGGAKMLGKFGSMIMGGLVGGAQATGTTMEAMADAGFDAEQQSKVLPFIMSFMPLTEGLISGGWMGRYLSKDITKTYFNVMRKEFAKAYEKSGGKLLAGDAPKMAKLSVTNFWNNPALREWVQKGYLTRELPLVTGAEVVQEISEDLGYNTANLWLNLTRPDYFKDVINSGINDLWGSDGVFNPSQMLETAALTAFATGISDAARTASTGRFSKGASTAHQKVASEAWLAKQASEGNLDTFISMAAEEAAKESNVFGSKKSKLSEIGADNIVIPASQTESYKGMNLGVENDNGDIVIDNMADARYFQFLQDARMLQDIASSNGLDGKSLNSKMLHELVDVNKIVMSQAAIKAAIDVKEANDAIVEFETMNANVQMTDEQKEVTQQTLSLLQQQKTEAQRQLDYYTKIEEGTNYSKAVNETMKTFLTTYNIAEENTRKQMNVENIDPNNKKMYNMLKTQWQNVLKSNHNYQMLDGLVSGINDMRLRLETDNNAHADRLEASRTNKFENIGKDVNDLVGSFTKVLDINDDASFIKMVKSISNQFNTVIGNINNAVTNDNMSPDVVSDMHSRFSSLYNQTLDRLNNIKSTESVDVNDQLTESGISEEDAMVLSTVLGTDIDYKTTDQYKKSKKKKTISTIMDNALLPFQAGTVDMPVLNEPVNDQDTYNKNMDEVINKLRQPISITDAYDKLINNIEQRFDDAADAVNPESTNYDNPYADINPKDIASELDKYTGLIDAFENSYDVAKRLHGKKQFTDHSNANEQQIVDELSSDMQREKLIKKINTIRASRERFAKTSGLSDLSSIDAQQQRKAIFITAQVNNIKYILSIVNATSNVIPQEIINDLDTFNINTPVTNSDGSQGTILSLNGNYTERQLADLTKTENTIIKIIDLLKTNKVFDNEQLVDKLLIPYTNYLELSNPKKDKTETFTSAVGFDGNYNRGGNTVYDIDQLRLDASQVDINTFAETYKDIFGYRTARMVVVERLRQYADMLMLIQAPVTLGKIQSIRHKINGGPGDVSTYEQEMVENSIIAFTLDGSILKKIHNISKDYAATDIISDMIIIPGDYGTGKTQHVMRRALDIVNELTGTQSSLSFYAPSQNLLDTHRNIFFDKQKTSFNMISEIDKHKPIPGNENEILIIDEGSLLNEKKVKLISKLQKSSEGKLKIIILADLNQMRDINEMNGSMSLYPDIMSYGFKTTTLTEQFSTNSPIINQHAKYWKDRASQKNMSVNAGKLPMGYVDKIGDRSYGVQYSQSDRVVVDSFLSSTNDSKSLIFEDKTQYDNYIDNTDNDTRQALKDNDSKIFFIHYDENIPSRVIQGLRKDEIYIVQDYKNMYFHVHNQSKVIYDYVSVYTAFGRATKYVNINVGAEAGSHMVTDPLQAAPIGDTSGNNKYAQEKVRRMREANEIRFTSMKLNGGSTILVPVTENGETKSNIITITDKDFVDHEISWKSIVLSTGETKYTFYLSENGVTTKIGYAKIADPTTTGIENAASTVYDEWNARPKPVIQIKKPIVSSNDITRAYISQALAWTRDNSVYTTPYFYLSEGELPDDKTLNEIRAMQSFILENANDAGLTFHLEYNANANVMTENGLDIMPALMVVLDDSTKIQKLINNSKWDSLNNGIVKNVINRLRSGEDINKYRHVSVVARPLSTPVGEYMGKRFEPKYIDITNLTDAVDTIRRNYMLVANNPSTNEDVAKDLIKQMHAQIGMVGIFDYMIKGGKSTAVVTDMDIKIKYNNQKDTNVLDFILQNKHNGLFFMDDTNGPINPVSDETKQPTISFKTSSLSSRTFSITVKTPRLSDPRLKKSNRIERLKKEDNSVHFVTTSEPVTKMRQLYDDFNTLFSNMNVYNILKANRQNIKVLRDDGLNKTINTEYKKYFSFSDDGKFINLYGNNLNERKANLDAIINLVYDGKWKDELFDFIERDIVDNKLGKTVIADDQFIYTNAERIDFPHFFMRFPDIGINISSNTEASSYKIDDSRLQESDTDLFDTRYTTILKAQEVISDLLGQKYMHTMLDFANGLIYHDGRIATGMVQDNRMTLANTDKGVRFSSPYHETFHIVWNSLITPENREYYERLARKIAKIDTGKNLSGLALEEWMAGAIGKKAVNRIKVNDERGIWNKFKLVMHNIMRFFTKNRSDLDVLYNDILDGKYRDQIISDNDYLRFENEEYEEDSIDRFIQLKKNIQSMFPGNRGLLRLAVNRTKFNLVWNGPLGNIFNFENNSLIDSINERMESMVALSTECGNEDVEIRRGDIDYKFIKHLNPEDYKYIYSTDKSLSDSERKNAAQSAYRTWFLYREDNARTILQHIIPEYDPERNNIGSGKLYDGIYGKTDLDPYTDGFSTELKLQLSTIPIVRVVSGQNIIDSKNPKFVDTRLMIELVKRAGIDAHDLYVSSLNGNKPLSHVEALRQTIENMEIAHGIELDKNGNYISNITAALKSFENRFFGESYSTFIDNQGTVYSPLMAIAEKVYDNRNANDVQRQRADKIMSFLSMMSSNSISNVVTRNTDMTIYGNENGVFNYGVTEYGNNPFENSVNRIKNALDGKFTNGILVNERTIKNIDKLISVEKNDIGKGNVSVGMNNIPFINVKPIKGATYNYSFASMGDDVLIEARIRSIIDQFNIIRPITGLTIDILPNSVIRQFLINKHWTTEMKDVASSMQERGMGNITSRFSNPESFFAAFTANILYAFKMQTLPYNMKMEYSIGNTVLKYDQTQGMSSHRKVIKEILENDKVGDFTIVDGEDRITVNKKDILGKIFTGNNISEASYVNDFMNNIGATSVYSGNADSETLTSEGINMPIPSQFFTAIDLIASQVASITGNVAGNQFYRPDGRKQHTLQGRNMINTFIDGTENHVNNIERRIANNPEFKDNSPLFDKDGTIAPYLIEGNGKIVLDHIGDFFGMKREYGSFHYGNKIVTPHDFVVLGINAFLNKVYRTTSSSQIICTPMMTLSDTGKIYLLYHKFSGSQMIKLLGPDKKQIQLNYASAHEQIRLQARKINRRVELSLGKYKGLIGQINVSLEGTGHSIPFPTSRRKGEEGKVIGMDEYVVNSRKYITTALNAMNAEQRSMVMDMVRKSSLKKGTDIIVDEKNNSFSIGFIASDNIPNLTTTGSIYSKKNRTMIMKETNSEKLLKELFHDDFVISTEYMEALGYTPSSTTSQNIIKAGSHNGQDNKSFYNDSDLMKVNEALFAYYMMFHIANNAFDDINGSIMNYKNVVDQVKRMGPQNTPKQLLNTNMKVGRHYIGSLPTKSHFIPMYDLSADVDITDTMKENISEIFNGQSYVMPLYRKMFEISSGGQEYSSSGKGSMIKTLIIQRDPIAGDIMEIKHAAKYITDHNFNNSSIYRKMVFDGLKTQDKKLVEDIFMNSLPDGHEYKSFSWYDRFTQYYDEQHSMDKAMDMLFNDMRNSQYVDEQLYHSLVNSVVYGYNPVSTIKNSLGSVNKYDPRTDNDYDLVTDELDNTQIGIVHSVEQPLDASKKQAPPQQIEAFMGISEFRITDTGYGVNPGIAINRIRKEIYDKQIKKINTLIANVVPKGIQQGPGQPLFNEIDWLTNDILVDKRDLSYAVAQFEWFMREQASKGMADAFVQGNYVEMLASEDITREIPQMRNKMVQSYRQYINKQAIRPGMTGMRTVQSSGAFHEYYELKTGEDKMLFTRDEALEYLGVRNNTIDDFMLTEKILSSMFNKRGLKDMRVENSNSIHGEVVMPYVFAQQIGLRRKGVDGSQRDETLRDIFCLNIGDKKVNIASADEKNIGVILSNAIANDQIKNALFFDAVLVRKALKNITGITRFTDEVITRIDEDTLSINDLINEVISLRDDIRKSLTVFANRVPSNRLGSGGWMDIVGFHYDGNEMYIPVGMTLLNDSDFDIDQLTVYMHNIGRDGHRSNDDIDILQSKILDIIDEVFMATENQQNIFIKSTIEDQQRVADEIDTKDPSVNANTLYSLTKTYNDNKGGADAIGILANTLSASAWLQTLNRYSNIVDGDDNPMYNILDRTGVKGKSSLVVMVGDWLQSALDNAKNNTLGKYGITMEAVPIVAVMVANGPGLDKTGKQKSDIEFFREIKDFFTNYSVRNAFFDASLGTSLHYSKSDHNLYINTTKHLVNVISKINALKTNKVETDDIVRTTEYNDTLKGLVNAKTYLGRLQELIVQAEALRGMSRILSLRNEIPAVDDEFNNAIQEIEMSFGTSLNNIVKGNMPTRNEFAEWYKTHNNEYITSDVYVRDQLLNKALKVHDMLNLGEIINAMPMLKVYLSELLSDANKMGQTFMLDSPAVQVLEKEYQAMAGYNTWNYSGQKQVFRDGVVELVLDDYFAQYQKKVLNISIPERIGNTYMPTENIFNSLDMSNIYDRQIYTLQFPNFISMFKTMYNSAQDMENAFSISPDYVGISKAFYDEEGNYTGNYFINNIDSVGNSERRFIGITTPTNQMTEERKRLMMADYDKLPKAIRNLFVVNELIVNKLGYHNGSIVDIIGIEPYREGISQTFNVFARKIRSGQIINDVKERFMDYMALNDGMTKYVKAENIDDKENPKYVYTFEKIGNFPIKRIYKANDNGKHTPIFLSTNRAGISMQQNPISVIPTISLTADEHASLKQGNTVTKTYPRGHSYTGGTYNTDGGNMVSLRPSGIDVIIKPLGKSNEFTDDGQTVYDALNNKAVERKMSMLISNIQRSFPGIKIIQETTQSTIEKGKKSTLSGWVDSEGVHYNMNAINSKMPVHELAHMFMAIIKTTDPQLYEQMYSKLDDYLLNVNPDLLKRFTENHPDYSDEDIREELMGVVGGCVSKTRIEQFFANNNIEPKPSTVNGFFNTIKNWVDAFWNAVRRFFSSRYGSSIFDQDIRNMSIEDIFKGMVDDILAGREIMSLNDMEISALQEYYYHSDGQIKEGVDFVFEENPELSNEIYEVLGFGRATYAEFETSINPDVIKTAFKHKILIGLHPDYYFGNTVSSIEKSINVFKEWDKYKPDNYTKLGSFYFDKVKAQAILDKYNIKTSINKFIQDSSYIDYDGNEQLAINELYGNKGILKDVTPQQKQRAQQLYSEYLDTIFPDSKVKDIVYRGGNLGTKQPQDVEAFTTNKSYAEYRAEQNNTQVYPAILNIQESKLLDKKEIRTLSLDRDEFEYQDYGFTDNKDQTKQLGNFYTVKENNRHILGSKQDIEGFKKFADNNYQGFDDMNITEINNVSDIPNILINNSRANIVNSYANELRYNPDKFANMVYNRRYSMNNGSTVYIEWLGRKFKFDGDISEQGIKKRIISEILPFHLNIGDMFTKNIKTVMENRKQGLSIDESIEKVFINAENERDEENKRSYISINQIHKLIEFAGGNDQIVDVLTLSDMVQRYPKYAGLVDESMIGFNPIIVLHNINGNNLDMSISDISAGDLGMSDTLTGEAHKLSGRFKTDIENMMVASKVTWSNSKRDARAAALTLTIAGINHFAQKQNIRLKIRRAGVYGMRGGITGSVESRNIYDRIDAFGQVREVMQYPGMQELTKNVVLQEIVDDDKAWDASNIGISHLFELQSYYAQDNLPDDLSTDFAKSLIGKDLSRHDHIRVLRKRQRVIEKRAGGHDTALNDAEYQMIAKAIMFYNRGWNVNNMNIDDISVLAKNIVNVHNIGNDIVQYASIEFEASKSAVVGRTNTFSDELTKYINASRKSHKITSTNAKDIFDHLFPKTLVKADKKYESYNIEKGDNVQVTLYNQIYCSTHPDTNSLLKNDILTAEDIALADFIVKSVKDRYIQNILSRNRMKSNYTIDDAVKDFELRYTEGTIPVVPATQEQNFGARKMKKFFHKFMNKMANSDIQWGDLMSSEFGDIHSRFEKQISFENQLKSMGLVQNDDKYEMFDYNAITDQSNNLEYTIKFFVMDMERNREYSENVTPVFNDCIAITNFTKRNMGTSQLNVQSNVQSFLQEYYNLLVEHKRLDDTSNDKLTKKAGPIVRTALSINTFMSLAYRPLVWIKSAYFNEQSAYLSAFSNNIANWGIKNGERLDMPGTKEVTKAHELLFTDYHKVWHLAQKMQLINGQERDVLENIFSNVAGTHLFKQQLAHIGNWYTDAVSRCLSMVSYMLLDGSYDAHIYDPKTSELTYDVKKDKRFYENETDDNMHDGWNVVHRTIMDKQSDQGLLDDGKQVIGYDYEEINKRFKWYSDKYIIGSMDPYQKVLLGNYFAGASFTQFRSFSFDKIWNAFSLGGIKTTYGGKMIPVLDENGEWITVEQQMIIESNFQSIVSAIKDLKGFDHHSASYWQSMPPVRRRNLANTIVKLGVLGLITAAFKAIDLPDRDEKKLEWLCSEITSYNTVNDIFENPMPLVQSVSDLWNILIGRKRFGKILRYTGPVNDVKWFYELISDNDEVFPYQPSEKELEQRRLERQRKKERDELRQRIEEQES